MENLSLAIFFFSNQGLPPGNVSGADSFLRLFLYFLWNMSTGHGVKEAIYFCVATRVNGLTGFLAFGTGRR